MRKKKYRTLKYMISFIFITVFMVSAVLLWQEHRKSVRIEKAYREAGGEIVVIFDREMDDKALDSLAESFRTPVEVVKHMEDYALFYVQNEPGYQDVMESLKKNPHVKAVQENCSITAMKSSNDTYSDTQWAINNPGRYLSFFQMQKEELSSTSDIDMDVVEAWDYMKTENKKHRKVVVAIVDTGVDYAHPDLAKHMWVNEKEIPGDGKDNDNNGYVDDIYGWDFYNKDDTVCHYQYNEKYKLKISDPDDNDDHGTHIAGIIGAVADNGIGIAGTASNIDVKLMSLKINGGPDGTGSIANAIEAIKYATMMGADICNLSWGTSQYTPVLKEVMMESDMLFVAAAGNSGTDNNDDPIYPANLKLDNLISVTFIDADGELTYLSNYGESSVDVAAPGDNIFSTVVGTYAAMSGSSMAAPQVSAVAALIYSYYDNLYPSSVKGLIVSSIKPIQDLSGYILHPGIPNAYKAVTMADNLDRDSVPPEISLETIYDKSEIKIPVTTKDRGGSGIRVIKWLDGEKTISDFGRGISGTLVTEKQITVEKAGKYTFYASDYAGNDTLITYEVKDDSEPPKISASYTVSDSYKTRTVTVRVSDTESEVKRVKYMAGNKTAKEFLPLGAGAEITLKDGKAVFKVKKDGTYSIYAIDNRGNMTVKQISIKTIKVTDLKLTRTLKTMVIGEQYAVKAFVKPYNATDRVTYTSSEESIATISSTGTIKALTAGSTYITARSNSGIKAICKVTVVKE